MIRDDFYVILNKITIKVVRELQPRKYVTPGNIELVFSYKTHWSVSCLGAMIKNTLIDKKNAQR